MPCSKLPIFSDAKFLKAARVYSGGWESLFCEEDGIAALGGSFGSFEEFMLNEDGRL